MNNSAFISELKKHIKGDVLSDEGSLGIYATDASVYQIKPHVIVLPKDDDDVKSAVSLAKQFKITILPRGAGTSLAGQTVGTSMILDFSKYMNNIIEVNTEERWVRTQPGIARDVLNEELKQYSLHFAPDPATSSRANVGGMVGNNSSGTKSILYGKTVDHVLEANILLADGETLQLKELDAAEREQRIDAGGRESQLYATFEEIVEKNKEEIARRFPKVMRRVGGYNLDEFIDTTSWNLSKLITGSEGTLATTLEVKLNLEPLPKHKSVCVVHFSELLEAIRAVEPMLEFTPSAVEILDKTVVDLSRENLTTKRSCHFIEGDPEAILIVEFYAETKEDVLKRPTDMIKKLKELGFGYAYPLFPEGSDYEDVWIIRKKGLGLMLGLKGEKKPLPFIEDAGIPTANLPEYIDRVLKICKKNDTDVAMYAHASVGVIHVRPILDLRQHVDIDRFKKIAEETFELVVEYGGSWSGEHGDGLVRSPFNKQYFGDQLYAAFKEVKNLFDPDGLMNPGKIIDAPDMTENLRYGASYTDQELHTHYKYTAENSFKEAVHMCTGVGECRKTLGGTMCPSYKATRDEEHSTRGRANAMRLAMSGQLDTYGLTGERLKKALDLCLSCKACKSECPSNVDMAKLKAEVMQMHYDANGTTLRDRLVRDSRRMAQRLSGPLAGFINAIQSSKLFRSIMQAMTGIDKKRNLPGYAKESFANWYRSHARLASQEKKKVALFADTYINYHEPSIGIAAYQLLTDCGYQVLLANAGCCQRPRLSHGFLREAKKDGLHTAMELDKFMANGIPVLVCEPSCASALNDDLPDLLDNAELGSRLRNNVMMIDQFLHREFEEGKLNVEFSSTERRLLVHGHCHQKALYGTQGMNSIFDRVEGLEHHEVDSGCCGMAGSFGYEQEHYEVSKNIGELALLPAVRELGNDAGIVACGFSCRHQIAHHTGKKAKHWVEVLQANPS